MTSDVILDTDSKNTQHFAPSIRVPPPVSVDGELEKELAQIPDKMNFKIGEVADLVGVKPYVLRYWESEFGQIKPEKSAHNQRMYSRNDVITILMIKKLLYRDKFSIEGARGALRYMKKEARNVTALRGAAHQIEDLVFQAQDLVASIQRVKRLFL